MIYLIYFKNDIYYYINFSIISINSPLNAPMKYIRLRINKFSFKFLFALNKTIKATPLPVSNPAITLDKDITPLKYNSVRTTLAAQFGINPTKLEINGLKR